MITVVGLLVNLLYLINAWWAVSIDCDDQVQKLNTLSILVVDNCIFKGRNIFKLLSYVDFASVFEQMK